MERAELWVIPRFHICEDNCEIHGQQKRGRRLPDIVGLNCLRVIRKELEGEHREGRGFLFLKVRIGLEIK